MLHIHFGAGRLGLGLVAPFFKQEGSELFLLNRAESGRKATGSTALKPSRRNELLERSSRRIYLIDTPGPNQGEVFAQPREQVDYDAFLTFDDHNVGSVMERILAQSTEKAGAVIVTASVLSASNYAPIVDALNVITRRKQSDPEAIGGVYLIACENTVSAYDVLQSSELAERIEEQTHAQVRAVPALVDRVCVGMEEAVFEGEPTVMVRAEEYGSLKLQSSGETDALRSLLQGSRIEFSAHLGIEKEIKSWLLNGSHWLIALTAFQEAGGNPGLKLNEFICSNPEHERYAAEVVEEMRLGVEALLRSDAKYKAFIEEVDVRSYLDGAASAILQRFQANQDTITRILARFRAPKADEMTTVQSFAERFLHRIEPPLLAYQANQGGPAKAATQGLFNLFRLQASGTYIDTAKVA